MNKNKENPAAIIAAEVPARTTRSVYPEPFASMMSGREKRPLGDMFGIKKFGINLTRLAPGSQSALLHKHTLQEEFIFILEGQPTLITETNEIQLQPGMCAGFIPDDVAHKLENRTTNDVVYLEVGDRIKGDAVSYPADDLVGIFDANGQWSFAHKNGEPY
jgi:uncharacterized cupin superfamily protein